MDEQIPEHKGMGEVIPPEIPPSGSFTPSTSPSTSSIVALVLGILAFVMCGPCTGIPAFIVGLMELNKIKKQNSPVEGKPFALIGTILGGINAALVIIAILIYSVIVGVAILGGALGGG